MEAVLIFQSYEIPSWQEIEPGMMFTYLEKDSDYIKIRTIIDGERHNKEEFIRENGHPVMPYVCAMNGTILAKPEEIGWWDCGEDCDSYTEIGEKEFNLILENEGLIDVETTYDDDEGYQLLYMDGKVIISIPQEYEESEEEFSNDVNETFTPNEPYNYDDDESEEW
jgi:hypothetical protein